MFTTPDWMWQSLPGGGLLKSEFLPFLPLKRPLAKGNVFQRGSRSSCQAPEIKTNIFTYLSNGDFSVSSFQTWWTFHDGAVGTVEIHRLDQWILVWTTAVACKADTHQLSVSFHLPQQWSNLRLIGPIYEFLRYFNGSSVAHRYAFLLMTFEAMRFF